MLCFHALAARVKYLQKGRDNFPPFVAERRGRMRPVGAAIPIARVAVIAFDPVELGVDPSAGLVVVRLRQAVRFVPFTGEALCMCGFYKVIRSYLFRTSPTS